MRLTVIGSGDAFGSGGRFNTCFLIETAGRTLLLDCGASTPVALQARGIDANAIDAVVLSHLHGDHFGGLPFLLLQAQHVTRRERPLLIAGPPGTRARLEQALEVFFPKSSGSAWRFRWEALDLEVGGPHDVLGLSITTAEVLHQSGAPSTAVRLSDGTHALAYSGDTEWTDALLPIARAADLFICECYNYDRRVSGHMSWDLLREKLPALAARRTMITHMNATMLARVEEARGAGVLVAEDGLVVALD